LFPWVERRAKEVFGDVELAPAEDAVGVAAFRAKSGKAEGEASAMNRKGKLLFLFDFTVTVRFETSVVEAGADGPTSTAVKGEIVVKEIANDEAQPTVKLTVDDAPRAATSKVQQRFTESVKATVLTLVDTLLDEMRAQIDGVQAPKVPAPAATAQPVLTKSGSAGGASQAAGGAPSSTAATGKSVSLVMEWSAPQAALFECFTEAQRVQAYTGTAATVTARTGTPFTLYGGSVQGEFTRLDAPQRLEARWRVASWPSGVWSTLAVSLDVLEGGRVKLTLSQRGVPASELSATAASWESGYFARIKALFGWDYKVISASPAL